MVGDAAWREGPHDQKEWRSSIPDLHFHLHLHLHLLHPAPGAYCRNNLPPPQTSLTPLKPRPSPPPCVHTSPEAKEMLSASS
jgi:hypothetical protein